MQRQLVWEEPACEVWKGITLSVVLGFFSSSLEWNLDIVSCHKRLERKDHIGEMSLCKAAGKAGFTA